MTNAGWPACAGPGRLRSGLRCQASGRKLRPFACACCARHGHRAEGGRGWQALRAAERLAGGRYSAGDPAAPDAAWGAARGLGWAPLRAVAQPAAAGAVCLVLLTVRRALASPGRRRASARTPTSPSRVHAGRPDWAAGGGRP